MEKMENEILQNGICCFRKWKIIVPNYIILYNRPLQISVVSPYLLHNNCMKLSVEITVVKASVSK